MKYITANPISKFYLPVAQELEKLPKQWLCNVIYSTDELNFAQWVKRRILERNQGIVKQKKLAINMDKDVMQAFLNSTAVSSKFKSINICFETIEYYFSSFVQLLRVMLLTCSKVVSSGDELSKRSSTNRRRRLSVNSLSKTSFRRWTSFRSVAISWS